MPDTGGYERERWIQLGSAVPTGQNDLLPVIELSQVWLQPHEGVQRSQMYLTTSSKGVLNNNNFISSSNHSQDVPGQVV